jgi:cation diffusion facilitator CzcD-associated flavoprotein CzcO
VAGLGEWLTAGAGGDQARWVEERVVVVGAGPAGLAAGWAIRRAGVDPLIVERADAVAASWRARHDHLRLNTHRVFSHQPGVRMPAGTGRSLAGTTMSPTWRGTRWECGSGWARRWPGSTGQARGGDST